MTEPPPRVLDALDPRRYDQHHNVPLRDLMAPFCASVTAWLQRNHCDVHALEARVITRESLTGSSTSNVALATALAARRVMSNTRLRALARATTLFSNANNDEAWCMVARACAEVIAHQVAYVGECMHRHQQQHNTPACADDAVSADDVYWLGLRRLIALNVQMRLFIIMAARARLMVARGARRTSG